MEPLPCAARSDTFLQRRSIMDNQGRTWILTVGVVVAVILLIGGFAYYNGDTGSTASNSPSPPASTTGSGANR